MFIINHKLIFIGISVLLVIASFVLFGMFGIKKGIDFTGGTTIEISYAPATNVVIDYEGIQALDVDVYQVNSSTYKFITTAQYDEINPKLSPIFAKAGQYTETQVNTVGPFRGISVTVSSWKYGVVAMLTMVHDIIIPAGVYTLLSHYYGAEVNTLFVIALLTIMAITISDKIVVFDRIRENLKNKKGDFDEIVGLSLRQTIVRSINTSLATVLALIALYIYGPESTKFFSLTLMVGMIVGTYSSICVASPILTLWNKK
jgi:preprotein translocase subunit SecF